MSGVRYHEDMMRAVERIERESRFSIAWMLAYSAILPLVMDLPAEKVPEAIAQATKELVDEIRKTSSIAKHRRRMRGIVDLLDRVETLKVGGKLPDRRRRRKRKAQ